ncbi:MAG TPA: cytochrome c biogenesis protein CcsA [Candidatus Paceibacterota bacterium]|nr:cytochrome c biogenesis protein CcsA [Verrucomicrobiota bacterium]HRY50209.1 cytochrome c biogenesis protein CcsA [Candidatus Paceibacterota bacterium]
MSWFTDRHCFALAVVIYGVAMMHSFFLWRQGFRRHDFINYGILFLGFLFHTTAMLKRGFSLERCPIHNLFEATMFIDWTIVTVYLVLGVVPRLRHLGAFATPLIVSLGVFALMPDLDGAGLEPQFGHWWTSLHAALSLLAYGAFGLSAVAALMYLTQDHDLKFQKFRAVFSLLPSIQRLEGLAVRLVFCGVVLLGMGLLVGFAGVKQQYGVYYKSDPKIHWSLLVWMFYLGILVAKGWYAQRGRRFAWGSIGGFIFVLLTFWGFNLFSTIHHP